MRKSAIWSREEGSLLCYGRQSSIEEAKKQEMRLRRPALHWHLKSDWGKNCNHILICLSFVLMSSDILQLLSGQKVKVNIIWQWKNIHESNFFSNQILAWTMDKDEYFNRWYIFDLRLFLQWNIWWLLLDARCIT